MFSIYYMLDTEDTGGNDTKKNSPQRAYIIARDADSDNASESKQWGGDDNRAGREAGKDG